MIEAEITAVPELDGTFIEIETMTADADDLEPALAQVRTILDELGVTEADLTNELYTYAVM